MKSVSKPWLKQFLGDLPLTAETYWLIRQQDKPVGGLNFKELQAWIPEFRKTAVASARHRKGKRILIFATLGYWIQHSALLGMGLAALGHEVSLAYLPYANWKKRSGRFDLRLQNVYSRSVLNAVEPVMQIIPWYEQKRHSNPLPVELQHAIDSITAHDVMYSEQVENVDRSAPLFHLRQERNLQAAAQAKKTLESLNPDLVIIPNGSILEFGAVYKTARYLQIPVVTYEFGEQRDRIWFAHNDEVMRQNTDVLWEAFQATPLNEEEWGQIRELFASRQKASLWENFSRRWQDMPSQGGKQVRLELGLDNRPIALLPANVIGDSLTLGRQIFTDTMTRWLVETVEYFSRMSEIQLLVRIHPGERYTKGPSVAQVIQKALPSIPAHIHLIPYDAPVNTYDLIQIADLGLVYTTTVGLEMAMSGVPVIVTGQTHYRGRGFTHDPDTWEDYFEILSQILKQPNEYILTRQQVDQAWNYAYRFFFEFPMPFPWHLLYMPEDVNTWPLSRVLSDEGQQLYNATFQCLTGTPRYWQAKVNSLEQIHSRGTHDR